ncbi:MAG: fumarylacetoacetate hydrolase family protein [Betaproteobacteria bacterium]|nr:fumarylacetoacetate hydrolase family protein [Betaproteobacteria bacterium]
MTFQGEVHAIVFISNIVQSIRAFRVSDLQEAADGLGQHFLYANLSKAQSKQDVLDLIAAQFTLPSHFGKNFDATGPFGPWLVSCDELPEGAAGLRIRSRLNGQVMQDANTSDFLFDVREALVLISACMTLEPGDVIMTGTPAGVGYARKPPVFMKAGDVCEIEIEGVGLLSNPVVDDVE